ncbi:MAG TPA: LLM class F420-dependent oxidoreductase [Candidatus Binatia bacterium]
MKFGVIPPYGMAPVEDGAFAIAFAQMAEEYGFESIWVVEHVIMAVAYESIYPYDPSGRSPFTADVQQPDPLLWLSYVAAATTRIRLATGVLILPQRNPLILAKELASLDRLSGGRVELGIGMGWVREEADAVGTCFDNRGRRADEYVAVMRTLWQEPVASFKGEFVNFDRVVSKPKPVQAGGVPIVVGGHTTAAARRAGRLGDGFFPLGVSADQLASLRAIMAETARQHGRDPDAITITCVGSADLQCAQSYADMGVDRMVIAALQRDLNGLRRQFEKFRDDVMRRV